MVILFLKSVHAAVMTRASGELSFNSSITMNPPGLATLLSSAMALELGDVHQDALTEHEVEMIIRKREIKNIFPNDGGDHVRQLLASHIFAGRGQNRFGVVSGGDAITTAREPDGVETWPTPDVEGMRQRSLADPLDEVIVELFPQAFNSSIAIGRFPIVMNADFADELLHLFLQLM